MGDSAGRKTIQFTVDETQREMIDAYAKAKGFDTASNLARVAIFAYIARSPIKIEKKPHRGTA